jgi:hypothetical protein
MMKNKNSSKGNDGKNTPFNPNENKEVKELTHKALVSFLRDQIKEKSDNKTDLDVLTSQVLEFLNSFILIGYNFNGEPISIISAHNQQEADSLGTLVNKFIFNNAKDSFGD